MIYLYIAMAGIALGALTAAVANEEKLKERMLLAQGITAGGLFIYGLVMSVTWLLATN
jgi:hypothetical protein